MNEPLLTASCDQLEALTTNHARQVAVDGGIPTDTAALLASYLARDLRCMVFHRG